MGVYNPKMKIPDSCWACPFCTEECFGAYKCFDVKDWGSMEERAKDCPLVEVKAPHGRLIDENALLREFETRDRLNGKVLLDYLMESQTIIEAEGIYSVATSTVYEKQLHKERVKEDAD